MLNKNKVGIALGGFLAIFHAVWAILVASNLAQGLMNLVFKLHMMNNPIVIQDFNLGLAVGLVVFTAVFGYIIGWVFAWIYNWAYR